MPKTFLPIARGLSLLSGLGRRTAASLKGGSRAEPFRRARLGLDLLEDRCVPAGLAPTNAEQVFLERLNDARANPAVYGQSIGLDLSAVAPSQPLAFDARLIQAARGHSQDMNDQNYFSHTGSDGSNPGARMNAAGFPTQGWGESIAAGPATPEAALQLLIVDSNVPDLGHRRHLLAIDTSFRAHQSVGVGIVQNGSGGYHNYYTIDSGYTGDTRPFLTGVVYRDLNGNGKYDAGEGLGGVNVTVAGVGTVVTWGSGGYSYQLSPGTYTVTASGGGLAVPVTRLVTVGSANARLNVNASLRVANDWNGDGVADLLLVRSANTASGFTEVDVLDGARSFQTALAHLVTPLPVAGSTFAFDFGDFNGDGTPDLYVLVKSGTGTHTTEVHILDGASNFQTWLLHTATALGEADATFDFQVVDYNGDGKPDLAAFKKSATGSHSTEIHVLSGATNFQTWLLHTATALGETGAEGVVRLADVNRDGVLDLVYVLKFGTGSGRMEVHAVDGASGFRTFNLHTATALPASSDEAEFRFSDFNGDGTLDLFYLKKKNTGSGRTEVHIVNGANWGSYLLQAVTPLPTY